jgi:hypothetical protein
MALTKKGGNFDRFKRACGKVMTAAMIAIERPGNPDAVKLGAPINLLLIRPEERNG